MFLCLYNLVKQILVPKVSALMCTYAGCYLSSEYSE